MVLIVDDNPQNIQIVANILKEEAINFSYATSGKEALEQTLHEEFDLILLDIMMPEMDGFEVCKTLKERIDFKEVPIIFLSAKSDKDTICAAFEHGCVDYITKPFNEKELKARVRTHLNLKSYQNRLIELFEIETEKNQQKEQLLIEQSKMAVVGELLRSLSHQLKQPLSLIGLLNENIKAGLDQRKNQDTIELTHKIAKSVGFMSETIENYSSYFKASKKVAKFSLNEATLSVIAMMKPLLKQSGIEVVVYEMKREFIIYGCKNELKQVLLNIISNAKDALSSSEVKEKKIVVSIDDMDGRARLKFCDNGGGIDSSLLPDKIFYLYETTKGDKGSGVGLYMCKNIIQDEFKGSIRAYNMEGWASFEILLEIAV